jgi:peptidoglycan/xylan/chitin deacetylase (PgdA/CDA1 family)
VIRRVRRALLGALLTSTRSATRRVRRGTTAVRLAARVRLGSPVGVVFAFHGVVERVADRDLQLNHVDVPAFGRAIDLICSRFDVVPVAELVSRVDGSATSDRRPVAALTFDDGYRSTLEIVQPALASRGLPYAIFVCPGLIDAGARLPSFVAEAAVRFVRAEDVTLPGAGRLTLTTDASRRSEAARVVDLVKRLPQPAVHALVDACRALLGEDEWAGIEGRFESEALLSWDEVRVLAAAGAVVGSHTSDHVSLHGLQAPDEVRVQLAHSRRRLEEELGSVSPVFCYPYGRYANLSAQAVEAVAGAGYLAGLTLETGTVRSDMNPLLLPRVYVGPKFDPASVDRLLAPVRDRIFLSEVGRLV